MFVVAVVVVVVVNIMLTNFWDIRVDTLVIS
jgi:hypothetical protein